jgi:hypothetical protein
MLWIETSLAAYTDGAQANKLSSDGSNGNISACPSGNLTPALTRATSPCCPQGR